jgi:hypothetical protein
VKRLALLLTAGALMAPAIALGFGGTYTVAECDTTNRDDVDALLHPSEAYFTKNNCGDPTDYYSLQIGSRKQAVVDHRGLIRFVTPSTDLGIVGVRVDAKLRGDSGNHPRLWVADHDLNELHHIAAGDSPGDGFHHYVWNASGPGAREFVASLTCENEDGCKQSNTAKVWIRNVRLIVADYADPELGELGGSLLDDGWVKGTADLDVSASDAGSGLYQVVASINGTTIGTRGADCALVPGSQISTALVPCVEDFSLDTVVDTTMPPVVDGTNLLQVCGSDFAGNQRCSGESVLVDNRPPLLAFADSQEARNPELVRVSASDAGSGLDAGAISFRPVGGSTWTPVETVVKQDELSAYIDSTSVPAGDYEFMATASDVAGNSSSTTNRSDGQPMVLSFPLKAGTRLSAHLVPGGERRETVAYGRDSKVSGRLLNASGKPIAREKVKVVEHFAAGALIDKRVRVLRTDRGGFFGERIPAGPSRTIVASYAGSKRYMNDAARAGRLVVRSKAGLRTSRHRVKEGHSVVFKGIVRHKGARIPPGGKLVELQVRDGRFWNTVRQAFYTKPDGRYRLRYRFRADYTRNAKFHFRVKIVREQGWPYRAPVRTRARSVVVVAR